MLLASVVLCLVCLALSIEIGKENTYQVTYFCRVRLILILNSTAALIRKLHKLRPSFLSPALFTPVFSSLVNIQCCILASPSLSLSTFCLVYQLARKKCSKSDFTDVHGTDNVTYSCELHCNRVPSFGTTADERPSRLPKSIYTVPIRAQNLNFKNEIISIEF